MKRLFLTTICVILAIANVIPQTGGPYVVRKSVTAGGGQTSAGGTFGTTGTTGQNTAGIRSTGGAFGVNSGFWNGGVAATPTPTPTPSGFEGDVAPRNSGDNLVLATDVSQLRRFAAGIDTPNASFNEAQRADCAPRESLGDGVINSSDVVQVRRYAAALDPPTASGGPAQPNLAWGSLPEVDEVSERSLVERSITLGRPVAGNGGISIPVELSSSGDEAGLSFTVEFDPALLKPAGIRLAPGVSTMTALTSADRRPGHLGVLLDSSEPIFARADSATIVWLTFEYVSEFGTRSDVRLTGSTAPLSAADIDGRPLPIKVRRVEQP